MPRLFRLLLSLLIIAVIVVAPFAYKSARDTRFRNFHVVSEGKLYRSSGAIHIAPSAVPTTEMISRPMT